MKKKKNGDGRAPGPTWAAYLCSEVGVEAGQVRGTVAHITATVSLRTVFLPEVAQDSAAPTCRLHSVPDTYGNFDEWLGVLETYSLVQSAQQNRPNPTVTRIRKRSELRLGL